MLACIKRDTTLKIVTWNCNGALRKKFEQLLSLEADLYIIQECENPTQTNHSDYKRWAESHLWMGDSKNKGLGVFASKNIELTPLNWSNLYQDHSTKFFLPCSVAGDFELLAVWAHHNNSPTFGYIGQLWKYLQVNKSKLKKAVVAGDFNSNAIWDRWDRWWNHADVVRELSEIGIESLYHKFTGEEQGKETQPTFFLQRNPLKPYHIDYIFAAQELSKGLSKLEVGQIDKWIKYSDHLPVICKLE